jgi:hypothetical protein
MPRLTRLFVTLLLATVLAGTAALAQSPISSAGRSFRVTESASADLFARFWSLLGRWSKNGCELDPSGRCLPKDSGLDNGCGLDPDGRCQTSQSTGQTKADNGCGLDPSGGCKP